MQGLSRWFRLRWSALPGVLRTRRAALGAGLVGLTVAGVAGFCLWPSDDGGELPTARVYRDVDACLLTDSHGVTPGVAAAPVWAGMQDASRATKVRVSFLSATGPETRANVEPFVNSLVQEHCSVVVAVGATQVQAVRAVAPHQKDVRFVVVGGGSGAANVSVVKEGSRPEVRDRVRGLLTSLSGDS